MARFVVRRGPHLVQHLANARDLEQDKGERREA